MLLSPPATDFCLLQYHSLPFFVFQTYTQLTWTLPRIHNVIHNISGRQIEEDQQEDHPADEWTVLKHIIYASILSIHLLGGLPVDLFLFFCHW